MNNSESGDTSANNGMNSDFKKLVLFKTGYPTRSRRLASPGIAAIMF
jgi:hypothetical protein